jgi:hypothetical protein
MTTTLRVNDRGEIGCTMHAPRQTSPRWATEGWRRMTPAEWRMLRAQFIPYAPLCETCRHRPAVKEAA